MPVKKRIVLALLLITTSVACSAQSAYVYPTKIRQRYLITTGDTGRPYESLGYLQLTRKGADLFGFIPVVDADFERLFGHELVRELEQSGADGIINVRFHERQWTTAQRLGFALFFFVPMPTQVELTGELIKFTPPAQGG
jgi:hypothetical protein